MWTAAIVALFVSVTNLELQKFRSRLLISKIHQEMHYVAIQNSKSW